MLDLHLIDYDKCHEYARSLCGQYGIPRCDADDIGSDAFVESVKRAWRTEADTNPIALANRLMYTSVLNVINRRNTHASRMLREADDIDERRSDGDGEPTDDEVVEAPTGRDGGPSPSAFPATTTLALNCECGRRGTADPTTTDDWENPFWLRLFNMERQKLRNERRKTHNASMALKLIKAGLKDSRLSLICDFLKISWGQFQTILNFFQERFDLCFQALRAWRAEN